MSDLGQDIGTSFISHVWSFFKQESELRKVKAMAPAELATWRFVVWSPIARSMCC